MCWISRVVRISQKVSWREELKWVALLVYSVATSVFVDFHFTALNWLMGMDGKNKELKLDKNYH